jgi:hypothetical protein
MKNLTEFINESIINEGIKDWVKDISAKGILKARNAWNKFTGVLTKNYTPHLPAMLIEKFEGNPGEWEDPNINYVKSLIEPVYEDIKKVVATAIYNEVEGKDITLYAGGHFSYDAHVFEMTEIDKAILMDRWNKILDYCNKTYNKGNFKLYDETNRYNDKNTFAISIELNNNGFYDYVNIFMYL